MFMLVFSSSLCPSDCLLDCTYAMFLLLFNNQTHSCEQGLLNCVNVTVKDLKALFEALIRHTFHLSISISRDGTLQQKTEKHL